MTESQPDSSERPGSADVPDAGSACELCGLPASRRAVTADIDGTEYVFCCPGCRQVFLILHDSGLIEGDYKQSDIYKTCQRLGIIENPDSTSAPPDYSPEDLKNCKEMRLYVDGMWCSACAWLIEKVVNSRDGVVRTDVIYASDTARILAGMTHSNCLNPAKLNKLIRATIHTRHGISVDWPFWLELAHCAISAKKGKRWSLVKALLRHACCSSVRRPAARRIDLAGPS